MAKRKCISAIDLVGDRVEQLMRLCELVHDTSPLHSDPWLTVVWQMAKDIEASLQLAETAARS